MPVRHLLGMDNIWGLSKDKKNKLLIKKPISNLLIIKYWRIHYL